MLEFAKRRKRSRTTSGRAPSAFAAQFDKPEFQRRGGGGGTTTPTFPVGGTLTGLSAAELVLRKAPEIDSPADSGR